MRPTQAIRYPLAVNKALGRFQQEHDYEAYLRQLIKQVLLTAPGERINRPDFGAGVRRLLFGPNGPATASLAETMVRQALDRWLASFISVDDVSTNADGERLEITIVYTVLARGTRQLLNLEVTL